MESDSTERSNQWRRPTRRKMTHSKMYDNDGRLSSYYYQLELLSISSSSSSSSSKSSSLFSTSSSPLSETKSSIVKQSIPYSLEKSNTMLFNNIKWEQRRQQKRSMKMSYISMNQWPKMFSIDAIIIGPLIMLTFVLSLSTFVMMDRVNNTSLSSSSSSNSYFKSGVPSRLGSTSQLIDNPHDQIAEESSSSASPSVPPSSSSSSSTMYFHSNTANYTIKPNNEHNQTNPFNLRGPINPSSFHIPNKISSNIPSKTNGVNNLKSASIRYANQTSGPAKHVKSSPTHQIPLLANALPFVSNSPVDDLLQNPTPFSFGPSTQSDSEYQGLINAGQPFHSNPFFLATPS